MRVCVCARVCRTVAGEPAGALVPCERRRRVRARCERCKDLRVGRVCLCKRV